MSDETFLAGACIIGLLGLAAMVIADTFEKDRKHKKLMDECDRVFGKEEKK